MGAVGVGSRPFTRTPAGDTGRLGVGSMERARSKPSPSSRNEFGAAVIAPYGQVLLPVFGLPTGYLIGGRGLLFT